MKSNSLILLFALFIVIINGYTVTVRKVNRLQPAISSQYKAGTPGSSSFKYNYNTAFVPLFDEKGPRNALLVRAQNQGNIKEPYSVTPSVMPLAFLTTPLEQLDALSFDPITESSVVFQPDGQDESYGTEDPRVVYRGKTGVYYLLYSAVANTTGGIPVSRLALATTINPVNKNGWTRHGPLFPQLKWSKSGALLIRDGFPGPSYLFWGDSSLVPGIQVATTPDLITFTYNASIFIHTRDDHFDSLLIEAGPMPLPLSDGNYLFLYNSARHGYPSPKPDWDIQYNVGYVILDKNDPTNILERSENPILSPSEPWEIGTLPYLGLTPNVVFVEGWAPLPEPDTFVIFYGAADSVIGVGLLKVTKN